MANFLAAHIADLIDRGDIEHNPKLTAMAEWPLARIINAALDTERRAGSDIARQYDADFFLALGEAVMMLEMDKMYVTRVRIFRPDVGTAYEILTRGVQMSPSARLMYLLRGAFNEHRFGVAH